MLRTILLYSVTLAFLLLLVILAFREPAAVVPLAVYLGILFHAITGREGPPRDRSHKAKS